MKCLIIAAGQGSRLNHIRKKISKPLFPLLGVPLIKRVILTAKKAGLLEFVITIGYLGEFIRKELEDGSKLGVRIQYVENDEWEHKGNGISVLKAKELLKEKFVLLMADHIFDPRILIQMLNYASDNAITLAIDRREPLKDDTKVFEKKGKVFEIGKNIKVSNCIDTGIFICSSKIFSYIEKAVKLNKTELAEAIKIGVIENHVEIFDITTIDNYNSPMRKNVDIWWQDIDTLEDLQKGKRIVIENASKNPSDFLAAYIHKPIENKIVEKISKYNITPNQLTIIVNIIAYTAMFLFLFGQLLFASILTFIVGIVDGLDGKLARVKLETTKVGSMEHSFDLLFEFSWIIALSISVNFTIQYPFSLILAAGIIMLVSFYRHVYDQFRKSAGKSLDDSGRFERKFKRIAGRRNLFNIHILITVIMGIPIVALYSIFIHASITAIVYSLSALKHLREIDESISIDQ